MCEAEADEDQNLSEEKGASGNKEFQESAEKGGETQEPFVGGVDVIPDEGGETEKKKVVGGIEENWDERITDDDAEPESHMYDNTESATPLHTCQGPFTVNDLTEFINNLDLDKAGLDDFVSGALRILKYFRRGAYIPFKQLFQKAQAKVMAVEIMPPAFDELFREVVLYRDGDSEDLYDI